MRFALLLFVFMLMMDAALAQEPATPLQPRTRIEELTGLVPRVSNAVMVANGPFAMAEVAPADALPAGAPANVLLRSLAVGQSALALDAVRAAGGARVLQAVAANTLADEAPGLLNGTHLVLFDRAPDAAAVLSRLGDAEATPLYFQGVRIVSQSRTAPNGMRYAMYYAFPRPAVFASASALDAMREVIALSQSGASGVRVPPRLERFLDLVNTASPCWAVREVIHTDWLWRNAPTSQWPDGMLFDWKPDGRGRFIYVANDGSLLAHARQQFKAYPLHIRQPIFGVVELLQRGGMSGEMLYAVLAHGLGYSIAE